LTVTVYRRIVVLQTSYDIMPVGRATGKDIASFGAAGRATSRRRTRQRATRRGARPRGIVVSQTGDHRGEPGSLPSRLSQWAEFAAADHVVTTPASPGSRSTAPAFCWSIERLRRHRRADTWINKGSLGDFVAIGQAVAGTVAGERQ
jgi:hypothetical protein